MLVLLLETELLDLRLFIQICATVQRKETILAVLAQKFALLRRFFFDLENASIFNIFDSLRNVV